MAELHDNEHNPVKGCSAGNRSAKARQDFHKRQLAHSSVLMPALDPDPPVALPNHLDQFEQPISVALQKKRGPNSSGVAPPSKDVRPATLARKIASGSQALSQADIAIIASRIGWLQRNWFRRHVSNGYAAYFANRSATARSSSKTASRKDDASNKEAKLSSVEGLEPKRSTDESLHDVVAEETAILADIDKLDAPDDPMHASDDCTGVPHSIEGDPPYAAGSLQPQSGFSAYRGIGSVAEWSFWSNEISRRRPQDAPNLPEKPRTFVMNLPPSKAKAFLQKVLNRSPLETQIDLAGELRDDPEQLYAALTHSANVREDILDAFAQLGVELDA